MADAYADMDEAADYFEKRGLDCDWDEVEDQEAALVRGSDYIDEHYRLQLATGAWQSMFVGKRADGRGQDREWPRKDAVDYEGNEIDPDEVPIEVVHASLEAAIREGEEPGSLLPDFDPSGYITKEQVGPLSVTYADYKAGDSDSGVLPNTPQVPAIDRILAPVLRNTYAVRCATAIRLV